MARFRDRIASRRHPVRIVYYSPVHLSAFSSTIWDVEVRPVRLPQAGTFKARHGRVAFIRGPHRQ